MSLFLLDLLQLPCFLALNSLPCNSTVLVLPVISQAFSLLAKAAGQVLQYSDHKATPGTESAAERRGPSMVMMIILPHRKAVGGLSANAGWNPLEAPALWNDGFPNVPECSP